MSQALALSRQNSAQQKRIEDLQHKSSSLIVRGGSAMGFPFGSDSAFGIEYISSNKVKIVGGEIQIADAVPVTCSSLELTISVDGSKVGYEYDYAAKTLEITNFGASMAYESGKYRKWLYEFSLVNGVAYYKGNNILSPSLPSNYGDVPA